MKGVRFYLMHDSYMEKRKGQHRGNVVAVLTQPQGKGKQWQPEGYWSEGTYLYEAIIPLFREPNSVVCGGNIAAVDLRITYKRISEAEARRIHPVLFEDLARRLEA